MKKILFLLLVVSSVIISSGCQKGNKDEKMVADSSKINTNNTTSKKIAIHLPGSGVRLITYDLPPCNINVDPSDLSKFTFSIAGNCTYFLDITTSVAMFDGTTPPNSNAFIFNIRMSRNGTDGSGAVTTLSGPPGLNTLGCAGPATFVVSSQMVSPSGATFTGSNLIITHTGADSLANQSFQPPAGAMQINGGVQYQIH